MDKRVILAVAGSGKTTYIVNQLDLEKRSLIVTYTNNNYRNLRDSILRKFGHFPENITLLTYFSFLYSFCYRPFLSYKLKARGINYERHPNRYVRQLVQGTQQINREYFVDQHNRLFSNRIARLLELYGVLEDINLRLSKYFDNLFIDEVQDLAGHDFNLLKSISQAELEMIFVGDFYQHTFDTSRDGNTNRNLHNDYGNYVALFERMGMMVDEETLKNSYRCSPTICAYIREELGIEIFSNKIDDTNIIRIDTQSDADEIFKNNDTVKLFYREHYKFGCYSRNWGESKGENQYNDVCVVLNAATFKLFKTNRLNELNPQTKNKFYVACSRANNDLYFVDESFYKKYKR